MKTKIPLFYEAPYIYSDPKKRPTNFLKVMDIDPYMIKWCQIKKIRVPILFFGENIKMCVLTKFGHFEWGSKKFVFKIGQNSREVALKIIDFRVVNRLSWFKKHFQGEIMADKSFLPIVIISKTYWIRMKTIWSKMKVKLVKFPNGKKWSRKLFYTKFWSPQNAN